MNNPITHVKFNLGDDGGFWIKRQNGTASWEEGNSLIEELGLNELNRLFRVASRTPNHKWKNV